MLVHKVGDMFDHENTCIVNTVNTVGIMGKGIAHEFKKKYPNNYNAYRKYCFDKKFVPGGIFVFNEKNVTIINVATKKHWRNKSEIEYVNTGFLNIINYVNENSIMKVAMPYLGCGNGGLSKKEVLELMYNLLEENICECEILLYERFDNCGCLINEELYNVVCIRSKLNIKSKRDITYMMQFLNTYRFKNVIAFEEVMKVVDNYIQEIVTILNVNKIDIDQLEEILSKLYNFELKEIKILEDLDIIKLYLNLAETYKYEYFLDDNIENLEDLIANKYLATHDLFGYKLI